MQTFNIVFETFINDPKIKSWILKGKSTTNIESDCEGGPVETFNRFVTMIHEQEKMKYSHGTDVNIIILNIINLSHLFS